MQHESTFSSSSVDFGSSFPLGYIPLLCWTSELDSLLLAAPQQSLYKPQSLTWLDLFSFVVLFSPSYCHSLTVLHLLSFNTSYATPPPPPFCLPKDGEYGATETSLTGEKPPALFHFFIHFIQIFSFSQCFLLACLNRKLIRLQNLIDLSPLVI